MKIAFFDSGIGGITVLHEAMKQLPNEDFIYYADTLHVPYGTKPKESVKEYVREAAEQLMEHNIKALVIACNTATSIAISELRQRYSLPIIGMEPAVKPAVELNRDKNKRVLVLATPLTLQETKYQKLVRMTDDRSLVDSLPMPELVEYCEALQFDEELMSGFFRNKLSSFRLDDYGAVVLGCTHFPYYRSLLRRILPPHIVILDGSRGTVNRLMHILEEQSRIGSSGHGDVTFISSDGSEAYRQKMVRALRLYAELEQRSENTETAAAE